MPVNIVVTLRTDKSAASGRSSATDSCGSASPSSPGPGCSHHCCSVFIGSGPCAVSGTTSGSKAQYRIWRMAERIGVMGRLIGSHALAESLDDVRRFRSSGSGVSPGAAGAAWGGAWCDIGEPPSGRATASGSSGALPSTTKLCSASLRLPHFVGSSTSLDLFAEIAQPNEAHQ